MNPYYEQDGITLYHGDAREVLPTLEADILCFDPPYGIGLENHDPGGARGEWEGIAGDHNGELGEEILKWGRRKTDRTIIVFASPWNPWPGRWRNQVVWDKGGAVGGGGDTAMCLKRTWELIQVWNPFQISGPRDESVWQCLITSRDLSEHPCAKPVRLMSRCLNTFGGSGRTIIDPTCGSGSTLLAAKQLHRQAIGVEIEERYCEIAARRLAQGVLPFNKVTV